MSKNCPAKFIIIPRSRPFEWYENYSNRSKIKKVMVEFLTHPLSKNLNVDKKSYHLKVDKLKFFFN